MKRSRSPGGTDGEVESWIGPAGLLPSHNQSVLKAVALIGSFVDSGQGRTLTELAKLTGMNVSTAYRMLQTLTHTGVLRRNEGEDRYFIGPMLLALAGSTFSQGGFGVASDVLKTLAEETGESVSLGIRDANCVAVLLSAGSAQQFRFEHRPGNRVLLHVSAMGKALLAFGETPLPEAVAALGRLEKVTSKSIGASDSLLDELNRTRDRGYGESDEEQHVGVRSIAMVAGRYGEPPRLAVGVQGPRGRMTDERLPDILKSLKSATGLIAQLPIIDRLPAG